MLGVGLAGARVWEAHRGNQLAPRASPAAAELNRPCGVTTLTAVRHLTRLPLSAYLGWQPADDCAAEPTGLFWKRDVMVCTGSPVLAMAA